MKRPSFQFYPGDWLNDAALRMCSIGARGLWIDMICLMHQGSEYGYLKVNHNPILAPNLSRLFGATLQEVEGWLQELEQVGVFSRDQSGCIFSKRMVRDEEIRSARAAGGVLGGNPALLSGAKGAKIKPESDTNKVNHLGNLKPTPSSSSSSSSSSSKSGRSRKKLEKTFAEWLEEIKLNGEKAISTWAPMREYAKVVGIHEDMVELCWLKFKDRYLNDPSYQGAVYKDWRVVFKKAVSANWLGLWFIRDGEFHLTTAGVQAQREFMVEAA